MSGRSVLTEVGPDREAIRAGDRGAVLFDMGLATLPVDICIRTADPDLLILLRGAAGRSLFEARNTAMAAIVEASKLAWSMVRTEVALVAVLSSSRLTVLSSFIESSTSQRMR